MVRVLKNLRIKAKEVECLGCGEQPDFHVSHTLLFSRGWRKTGGLRSRSSGSPPSWSSPPAIPLFAESVKEHGLATP